MPFELFSTRKEDVRLENRIKVVEKSHWKSKMARIELSNFRIIIAENFQNEQD